MKKSIFILFMGCKMLCAQNLIENPGFESGFSGWGDLWTRDAGAGQAQIVDQPVHGGEKALFIEHWGEQDWSLGPIRHFPVKPGYIFEFSAWVMVPQMTGWGNLCITTLDKNQNYTDWSFQTRDFIADDQYVEYSLRFVVQENTGFIWPRFTGGGQGELYIDNVRFTLVDSLSGGETFSIDNGELSLELDTGDMSMFVSDRSTGQTYQMLPCRQFMVRTVSATPVSLLLDCLFIRDNFEISIDIELVGQAIKMSLSANPAAELAGPFQFPGEIPSRPDDFLIVPRASGMILPVSQKFPFHDFALWDYKATMAFAGVTNLKNGYTIVSDGPWDSGFKFPQSRDTNLTNVRLFHAPAKGRFGYNRTFYYGFSGKDSYVEMCRFYRSLQNRPKTFNQKQNENPNMAKLCGAVDFWALHNHFRTKTFVDSLYDYGIDRAIYSLGGGWYNTHDYSGLIEHIHTKGWLSSRYDIYTDVWPPDYPDKPWYRTEGYPEDVIVNADGSLRKGWLAYVDGSTPFQGYYTCSATHSRYAYKWIKEDLALNPYSCRFIDVELASPLYECYAPDHPVTRSRDAGHRNELLGIVKNHFGLVTGSEEARDFCFDNVDYGEGTMTITAAENAGYDWGTPTDQPGEMFIDYNMNPAFRLPLHQLVYHDVHVATWYTGDGQSRVPAYWDTKDLFNILYASMPLFLPPSPQYWCKNRQHYLTSYHIVSGVFRNTGFSAMTGHQMLTPDRLVQQTEFDNGWQVVVNFSGRNYTWTNKIIPPGGFYAGNGTEIVCRMNESGQNYELVRLSDRFFINPHNRLMTLDGVRTTGTLFLRKNEKNIHMAFIGDQTSIDLSPLDLPWPIDSVHITVHGTGLIPDIEHLQNGRLRINKLKNERFYRITGRFSATGLKQKETTNNTSKFNLVIYPNPANSTCCIEYRLVEKTHTELALYNILGEKVATLVDGSRPAGFYRHVLEEKKLLSGVYFCRLSTPQKTVIKKLTIIK